MIKDFKAYNESTVPNMEYIVGIPSGEVIDINYKDVNNLKQEGLISWNVQYKCYSYKDSLYKNVMGYLSRHGYNKKQTKKEFGQDAMDEIMNFFDNQKNIRNYMILPDGSIDVSGDIYVSSTNYTKIPLNFKRVSGDFIFKFCKLESLENCPEEVGGCFIVKGNSILSLREGPKYVGRVYDCSDNFLSSLEGAPEKIYGDFDCSGNFLTSLKEAPKKVKGYFDCTDNRIEKIDVEIECLSLISDLGSTGKLKKKFREEATYRW